MSRPHRSKGQARAYWQEILKRWQQSGLSASQFCRMHKISDSGFYTWRKKLTATQSTQLSQSADAPFVQVTTSPAISSPLILQLASGHTLHIAHPVNTDALGKALAALQEANLC